MNSTLALSILLMIICGVKTVMFLLGLIISGVLETSTKLRLAFMGFNLLMSV